MKSPTQAAVSLTCRCSAPDTPETCLNTCIYLCQKITNKNKAKNLQILEYWRKLENLPIRPTKLNPGVPST
jgi:hypothetical protein